MRTVGARKTKLQELDNEQALAFISEHHRQGASRPGSNLKSYGLLLDDELVAVALFCNPRTPGMQRRYRNELFRMAFKTEVRVPGGASKLIKHFLSMEPWDLFTYQDTSGESTDVYEHSGLTLIEDAKPKDILVRNGLTLAAATNNRRDWFSMEQAVRFGPDTLLGTKLGEVFREDGSRKSNIELFIDECGYHLESAPGDRVYHWRNKNISFYTYKITSSKDDGYYYGRHTVRQASPTEEYCLKDGYMGSGGKEFQEWISTVGADSLLKTVMSLHSDWESVVKAEHALIGDSYKTDPNCKNTQPGGTGLGRSVARLEVKDCPIHGETVFNGKSCMKCSSAKLFSTQHCPVHGETHFRSDKCETCRQQARWSNGECSVHGVVKLIDGRCINCKIDATISTKVCSIHGEVTHFGESCATCSANKPVGIKDCPTHGFVKHQGNVCSSCNSQRSVTERECAIHGVTTHQGTICMKCNSQAQFATKTCTVHGEALFKGDSCTLCTAQKAVTMRECAIHGLTKHQGEICSSCNAASSVSMRECPTHGLTKHQGAVCNRCNAQRSVSLQECAIHGEAKFQGGKCVKCRNAALITVKDCPIHGAWKHRGSSCYACVSDRRKAKKESAATA